MSPTLRVTSVTITTNRPHDLAVFYSHLLGCSISADEPAVPGDPLRGGWAQIRPTEGGWGPTLNFEYEKNYVPPVWPSEAGHQFASQHLDIEVDDLDGAVAWAVSQGAILAEKQFLDSVRVLFDPSGHPFCLFH